MKGNATFRPRKISSVRAKRQKKSTPTARASASAGGPRLKRSKKSEIKTAICPDREGMTTSGRPCSLIHSPGTLRYNLSVSGRLAYSSVSYAACLQAAEVLGVTWE